MTELTLNKPRGVIWSLLFYAIGVGAGLILNFYIIDIKSFKVDLLLVAVFVLVIMMHELTHYIIYRYFSGSKSSVLNLSKDKKFDLPYFKIKNAVDKKVLILGLVLPSITTSATVIVFNMLTGNLAYSLVLGLSLAMSGADFELAIQLIKQKIKMWKSLNEEFGFIGESN